MVVAQRNSAIFTPASDCAHSFRKGLHRISACVTAAFQVFTGTVNHAAPFKKGASGSQKKQGQ